MNDEMGHQVVLKSHINDDLILIEQTNQTYEVEKSQPFSRVQGVVMGMALIFGLFGLVVLFKNKFKKSDTKKPV